MEDDTSFADREAARLQKLAIETGKAVVDGGHAEGPAYYAGESSTPSREQPGNASGEGSEAPSVTIGIGPNEDVFTITSAIEALNFLLGYYSLDKPIVARNGFVSPSLYQAITVSRRVIDCTSQLARKSGKNGNIVMYLEQLTEYMEKIPGLAMSSVLECILFLRCAKVFMYQGCTESASQACSSAEKIAAREFPLLHLGIISSMLLFKIHGRREEHLYLQLREKICAFLELQSARPIFEIAVTSFIRQVPVEFFLEGDLEVTEILIDALVEALRLEGETTRDATEQGVILMELSFHYQQTKWRFRHQACLILLEQAIAALQQAECTCHLVDFTYDVDELFGLIECGCHGYLATALLHQGLVQKEQGFKVEAEMSYRQGLKLIQQHLNHKEREAVFHYHLWSLLQSKTYCNEKYGLPRGHWLVDDIYRLSPEVQFHYFEFLKIMDSKEAKFGHLGALAAVLRPSQQYTSLEEHQYHYVAKCKQYLLWKEERGDFSQHANTHAELCLTYTLMNDATGMKEHFFQALRYLQCKDVPTLNRSSVRQTLGQFALRPEIMELDHAFNLWSQEYLFNQDMLQDLELISQDHALHYFETSKHTCMALAKCLMLKAWALKRSGQISHCATAMEMTFKALMWAERGKGRMLMSFIGAIQKNADSNVDGSRSLHLPSNYTHDFEGRFLREETFATEFLQGKPSTSLRLSLEPQKKTLFVEHSFLDQNHLMTQVTDCSRILLISHVSDLSATIDKETQLEAEAELDSIQKSSSSNPEPSITSFKELKDASSIPEELGPAAGKVLSAMNKYGTNRIPFNRWIPGMVAGIQRRAAEAQLLRKKGKSFHKEEKKILQLLQGLYAILIKPVAPWIAVGKISPGIATIVFVPHEDLGVVPFASLHERDGSPYLIEQFAISVSPAIWCSRHCEYLYSKKVRSEGEEGLQVLMVGKKSGYPPPFADLTQAHEEVASAAKALERTQCRVELEIDSTPDACVGMKERVVELLPRASWVHLSVHGEVSPQFPQGSMLFGDNENQRLTATEIVFSATSAPWNARCAIASACQTGLGSVAGGGIMGFARSFILAGVPSCLLSMWEVNEAFCTSFMGKLYHELGSGMTLGHAIKITVESMMKEMKPAPPQKTKPSRFKSKAAACPEPDEPMWSILDWASFSCFGFPGVKLVAADPVALSRSKKMLALAPGVDPAQFITEEEVFEQLSKPTLFANGTQGFCPDQATRGLFMRMAARGMTITHGNDLRYWDWVPADQYSWFLEVARLKGVCWFEARGEIDCTLPPGTYTFSWRIRLLNMNFRWAQGWRSEPAHFTLSKNGMKDEECKCFLSTSPERPLSQIDQFRLPTIRVVENGWREYDVGEFSVEQHDANCVLKFAMRATATREWKSGLVIDGIVIGPRSGLGEESQLGMHTPRFKLQDINNFNFLY